jgi:integrase/recombinase XerC
MQDQYQPAVQSFLDYLRFEKRYSQHTIVSYQNDLGQFFAYLASQYNAPSLTDISSVFVRSWLAEMKGEDMTAKSINRKISTLKSFFKYHLRSGTVQTTPMGPVIAPKIKKRLPEFVKEGDMKELFEEKDKSGEPRFPEGLKGVTERLLLLLFYRTGMRLSELVNLKERQVDISKSVLKILGKGNKERVVPVVGDTLQQMVQYMQLKREYTGHDTTYFFVMESGKKLYPRYVYDVVHKYLGGVTTLNKKSPHILRHTFATHLTNGGADLNAVKELLGHASLAATQVYTHNTIEKLKNVYKKAHPKA